MPKQPKNVQIVVQTTTDDKETRSREKKTTIAQFHAILEWLEIQENYNLVEGKATSTMKTGTIAGAKVTKRSAYSELGAWVNQKCGTEWDRGKAENRFRVYKRMYKSTKRDLLDTTGAKFNVGPKDHKKGIFTIEEKLEKCCPYFKRMDILYGGRQNITPACVLVGSNRSAEQINAAEGEESSSDEDESDVVDDSEDDSISISSDDGDGAEFEVAVDDQAECALALASLANSTSTSSQGAAAAPPAVSDVSSLSDPSVTAATVGTNKPPKERKSKKPKKDADKTALLPAALKDKCAETVASASNAAELTAKIAEMKNNGTGKGRKDFTSTFADAKAKEIELAKEKFEFEKENYQTKRGDENSHALAKLKQADSHLQAQLQQDTKKAIITEMIRKGSSKEEINEYLQMLL